MAIIAHFILFSASLLWARLGAARASEQRQGATSIKLVKMYLHENKTDGEMISCAEVADKSAIPVTRKNKIFHITGIQYSIFSHNKVINQSMTILNGKRFLGRYALVS